MKAENTAEEAIWAKMIKTKNVISDQSTIHKILMDKNGFLLFKLLPIQVEFFF